ncbi:MAG: zinc ABC transporter substrate-binding protein [Geminicoccaceae bacterium]
MTHHHALCRSVALAAGLMLATPALADGLPVVASFSILGDMVEQVGGKLVQVTTLVGPDGDAHVYEPTPIELKKVAAAKVLVINGLGLEGWMERLQQTAGFKGEEVVATKGIVPLTLPEEEGAAADHEHEHGSDDPHAWQSLPNAKVYVANILAGLSAADPAHAATYAANAARYTAEIDALDAEARRRLGAIPEERRVIVTTHDAFGYFGAAYQVRFLAPQGVSTEAEASAADVAALIRQIRALHVPAVFFENIADPRLIQQITRETDAKIGGTLYSDALSGPEGPAATYLDLFRTNLTTLTSALTS